MPQDWNRREIEAVVDAYFWMLGQQIAGSSFVKKAVVRNLRFGPLADRSESSVNRKLSNVSGIMELIEAPLVRGFGPSAHFQAALKEHVMSVAARRGLGNGSDRASHRRNRTS